MPNEEKITLMFGCTHMFSALVSGDAQEVVRAMAMLKVAMTEFMETGYISYESVDTELCKFLEEMKKSRGKGREIMIHTMVNCKKCGSNGRLSVRTDQQTGVDTFYVRCENRECDARTTDIHNIVKYGAQWDAVKEWNTLNKEG